jgi:hydrogenase maturation factor HypF (carbamoyltransferase family)
MATYELGRCENCRKKLHDGERGFRYSDGPMACEACSPTYEEAKRGFTEQAFEEPESYRTFCQRMNNHLRSGGAMSEKYTVVL